MTKRKKSSKISKLIPFLMKTDSSKIAGMVQWLSVSAFFFISGFAVLVLVDGSYSYVFSCRAWGFSFNFYILLTDCSIFLLFFDNRLDVYIYDYLVKRNLQASAKAFQAEGKVSSDPVGKITQTERDAIYLFNFGISGLPILIGSEVLDLLGFPAIDAPGGFLFEWWSVFWDIFIARTNEKHSEVAASYIQVGL
ncbi:hypothetical protein HHK36_021541 [Tetracentron sinense]|uniref:Uncharacterized protein n=1 Tax=Tetracentron sinense TaxID=13715 RepID=A0A834YTX1_TETSI|nr:hypothetical protein HHK36_021541 [Tetracentron sinense]